MKKPDSLDFFVWLQGKTQNVPLRNVSVYEQTNSKNSPDYSPLPDHLCNTWVGEPIYLNTWCRLK